jgi:hypothetical protein
VEGEGDVRVSGELDGALLEVAVDPGVARAVLAIGVLVADEHAASSSAQSAAAVFLRGAVTRSPRP